MGEQDGSYEAYAAAADDPRFTDWLRERSEPDWTAAIDHRFTRELADGSIEDDVFARYLVQDYAFVDALVGTFGHAVGQAPTMAEKRRLVEFLDVVTDDENDYFERSFDALDVPAERYAEPERVPATAAFEDLLCRAAREGGYAETLAVLVPAEWVYLSWASAVDEPPEPFYLAEWVDLHAVSSFESFVEWLREELDAVGPDLSERRQRRVARLFERTVELEVAFFDAAYGERIGEGIPDRGGLEPPAGGDQ